METNNVKTTTNNTTANSNYTNPPVTATRVAQNQTSTSSTVQHNVAAPSVNSNSSSNFSGILIPIIFLVVASLAVIKIIHTIYFLFSHRINFSKERLAKLEFQKERINRQNMAYTTCLEFQELSKQSLCQMTSSLEMLQEEEAELDKQLASLR